MLLANFLQYDIGGVLSGLHNPGINPSLWTLKIEIGFYLIVPLIFAANAPLGLVGAGGRSSLPRLATAS